MRLLLRLNVTDPSDNILAGAHSVSVDLVQFAALPNMRVAGKVTSGDRPEDVLRCLKASHNQQPAAAPIQTGKFPGTNPAKFPEKCDGAIVHSAVLAPLPFVLRLDGRNHSAVSDILNDTPQCLASEVRERLFRAARKCTKGSGPVVTRSFEIGYWQILKMTISALHSVIALRGLARRVERDLRRGALTS